MSHKQFSFNQTSLSSDTGVDLIDIHDTIRVFCDFSKTFDYAHHETLVRELCQYDVAGRNFEFLKSYLSPCHSNPHPEGCQRYKSQSSRSAISMGVP